VQNALRNSVGPAAGRVLAPAHGGPARGERERRRAFERLSEEIRRCTLCPLSRSRSHAVVYRGSLEPRVVFVGEAPGAEEDRQGIPFVGRSGRLLDRAIEELGPPLGEYGILNLIKCRPPANRFDPSAARTCRPYLDRQLGLLRPRALVPLGARAWGALVPHAPPILSVAGAPQLGPGGWMFPLLHPAAALRSRAWRARWDRDVRALGAWLGTSALEML
jgi:uracil-DNA glycosylase